MDSIDDCRITCGFVKNESKREILKERLESLVLVLDEVCSALNDVCQGGARHSCLQCYDVTSKSYDTRKCYSTCRSERVRYSYCFGLSNGLILNVIAELGEETVIVTFYPFSPSRKNLLDKKCDAVVNRVT